jgi:transcriptional regulator with XRE-family HTH domain
MMNLSDRLTFLRKSTGKTQIPFAKEVGVSQSAYANYERGATEIPISLAVKVCLDYEISPSWLLLGEGTMKTMDVSNLLEDCVVSILKFLIDNDLPINPERIGRLVKFLFNDKYSGKAQTDEDTDRFLNTIL